MFQVFLIIFWATIRLQNRGEAVCDPSVGDPSGSQANHLPLTGEATPQSAELTAPLGRGAKDGGLRRCSLCLPCQGEVGQARSAWLGRVAFFTTTPVRNPSVSNPSGSQANHLPLTGEAMTVPLDRGGNPSVGAADSSPWQGSQGRSTWQGRQPPQSMRLFTAASIYSHTPRKFLFTSLFGMRRTVKP